MQSVILCLRLTRNFDLKNFSRKRIISQSFQVRLLYTFLVKNRALFHCFYLQRTQDEKYVTSSQGLETFLFFQNDREMETKIYLMMGKTVKKAKNVSNIYRNETK